MDREAQFLKLQALFHTLGLASLTSGKPTKLLRVRNGVGHQTDTQQWTEVLPGASRSQQTGPVLGYSPACLSVQTHRQQ